MSEGAKSSGHKLQIGTIALAAVALTLCFMVLRFPYDKLADRIVQSIEDSSGARLSHGPASLGLVSLGPGLRTQTVRVQLPSGSRLDFDEVGVRPALSLSWLRGVPTLAVDFGGVQGSAEGVLTLGENVGFRGRLEQVALGELPAELMDGSLQIEGLADLDVDVAGGEQGSEGSVAFQARQGVIQHPSIPLPLPYETLDGEIDLGGESMASIRRLELASPLASGQARGSVGRAPSFESAPLDLEIELTVSGGIRGSLNAQGVQVGNDGKIRLSVMGTPSNPIIR